MFHGKSMVVAKVQPVAKAKIIITNVNVVDVNVTTRNKVTKEQVSKHKEPKKQQMLLIGRKNNGLKSQWWKQFNKFRKHKPRQKGHPHPRGDGTQLG